MLAVASTAAHAAASAATAVYVHAGTFSSACVFTASHAVAEFRRDPVTAAQASKSSGTDGSVAVSSHVDVLK